MAVGTASVIICGEIDLSVGSSGANPTLGDGLELDVIAAVIVGGTSLFGGYGSVPGSVIGAIFIGIVQFGLLTMGYTTSISASHQRRDHSGSRLVESTLRAFVLRAGLPYCWVRIAFRPPEWSTEKAGGSDLKSIWSKLPYRSMA